MNKKDKTVCWVSRTLKLLVVVAIGFVAVPFSLGQNKDLPKEDVIEVPTVGEGLCVHNLFQSNMVLQRDKPISIWGWANPGEKVSISFSGQTRSDKADIGVDERMWKITLPSMNANDEPQTLTVRGKNKSITLENILIGDVWVLGGQSNMEEPLQHVENGQL